jgi:hypothetical protein
MSDTPGSPGGPESTPSPSNSPAPSSAPENSSKLELSTSQQPAPEVAVMPYARWETEIAPDLKDDFNRAAQMPERPEFPPDEGQSPISKLELEQLINERETPVLELHHRIGGTVQQATHEQVAVNREARIRYIQDRFNKMKSLAKDRFQRVNKER